MTGFNLVDEPWIPATARGEPVQLGLRETLVRAPALDGVSDASPLVTVALHRLLLAIVHAAHRTMLDDTWQALWERGQWDVGFIEEYLDRWHHRFDLFAGDRPFYQTLEVPIEPYARSIINMVPELSPMNSRLFTHLRDEDGYALTPAEAARQLLVYQLFAPGGLYTHEHDRKEDKYVKGAPLARGAVCLVQGTNLFRTLLLNLVRHSPREDEPFPQALMGGDRPAWERDEPARVVVRRPYGYLDWLTWQSRRIRLVSETGPDGMPAVTRALLMKGAQLPPGTGLWEYEQTLAFRRVLKPTAGADPWVPVGFQRDRAVWRDSQTLFVQNQGQRPKVLEAAGTHLADSPNAVWPLALRGIAGDRYNVLFWREEHLPLPFLYLRDTDLQERLREALELVEEGARIVQHAVFRLAELMLAPDLDGDGREADAAAARTLAESFGAERRFWGGLEEPFTRFLVDQAEDRREEEYGAELGTGPFVAWARAIRRAAWNAVEEAREAVGTDGRALRGGVEAESILARRWAHALRERRIDLKTQGAEYVATE